MSDLWTTLIDWKLPPHRLLGIWKTVLLDEGSKMNPSLGNKGFVCLWVRVYHNAIYEEQEDQERIKVVCNIILWTWNIISLDLKYYIVGLAGLLSRRTMNYDYDMWTTLKDWKFRLKYYIVGLAGLLSRRTSPRRFLLGGWGDCALHYQVYIVCIVFVFVCLLLQWDSKHYIFTGMTCSQKLDWRGSCPERTL